MRIAVTGQHGQVARSLVERAPLHGVTVLPFGRPLLDLADPGSIGSILEEAGPAIIVNAAAYTAVDQAESEPQVAMLVNGRGAGAVAAVARQLNVPVIQLSTDYVFDGSLDRPYRETDPVAPISSYGRSKLAGEQAVMEAARDHVILRTSWVYSPYGKNFVKTMLRLAEGRDSINVVADQWGSPTSALDIADGIIALARNLTEKPLEGRMRGVFHMTGSGEATWAELASEVFGQCKLAGKKSAEVVPISSTEFPTAAKRPSNSRLDCSKLAGVHGIELPHWRSSVADCVRRLHQETAAGDRQ